MGSRAISVFAFVCVVVVGCAGRTAIGSSQTADPAMDATPAGAGGMRHLDAGSGVSGSPPLSRPDANADAPDATDGDADAAGTVACFAGWSVPQRFPTFDKKCDTAADCVVVRHQTDCCFAQTIMAINAAAKPAFDEAEGICVSQYPLCECIRGAVDEDGRSLPSGADQLVAAQCDDGTCRGRYAGQSFACGSATCIEFEYCYVDASRGSGVCSPSGGCTSCSCISQTGCACTAGPVGVTLTCGG